MMNPKLRILCVLFLTAVSLCAQAPEEAAPAPQPAPAKRVVVDKTKQQLTAYEGERIVLQSRVSTGRQGRTPSGNFKAGVKQRMHYSRLYDNAPMPFSVQFSGNFFIHGFSSVPNFPASHGCIRLPLTEDNPAKRFFEWVEIGTPIEVTGEWVPPPSVPRRKR